MSIKKLSQEMINKIAAGEVVERPASVVKELMENSLDAGARNITVDIGRGGKSLIQVSDDGSGMNREDAKMALEEHATSKLEKLEDLFNINSFGFRGEALASISSVSRFKMQTKLHEDLSGTEVSFSSGVVEEKETACSNGTKVQVADLFYNIPARRSYLKTDFTEMNHIMDVFNQFALVNLDVNLKLFHDKKLIFNYPKSEDWKNRIYQVLGGEIGNNLIELGVDKGDLKISGFIGKPQVARANRKAQYLFVNGRFVNNIMISKAVMDAYYSLIPKGEHPVFILNLEVDTESIDVNVHPRKLEVRFSDSQGIFRFVRGAASEALEKGYMLKTVEEDKSSFDYSQQTNNHFNNFSYSPKQISKGQVNEAINFNKQIIADRNKDDIYRYKTETPSFDMPKEEALPQIASDLSDWRLIGQVMNSYILVESVSEGLLIIDQHAAAERVNYEKLKQEFNENRIESQQLLLPITVELSHREVEMLKKNREDLINLGFEIDEFGGNSFNISSVPSLLKNKDPKIIVMEILSELEEVGSEVKSERIDYILKTMSCKSAIKFGDKLEELEMKSLLDGLSKIDNKMACCHGRPIVLAYSWDEIDKGFGR